MLTALFPYATIAALVTVGWFLFLRFFKHLLQLFCQCCCYHHQLWALVVCYLLYCLLMWSLSLHTALFPMLAIAPNSAATALLLVVIVVAVLVPMVLPPFQCLLTALLFFVLLLMLPLPSVAASCLFIFNNILFTYCCGCCHPLSVAGNWLLYYYICCCFHFVVATAADVATTIASVATGWFIVVVPCSSIPLFKANKMSMTFLGLRWKSSGLPMPKINRLPKIEV